MPERSRAAFAYYAPDARRDPPREGRRRLGRGRREHARRRRSRRPARSSGRRRTRSCASSATGTISGCSTGCARSRRPRSHVARSRVDRVTVELSPRGGAELGQDARVASRLAGVADAPPVPDQEMRKPVPVGARHDLDEVALDLDRIVLPRQPEPLRDPPHVGVDDDPLRLPELGSDDVGRLARHAGQPQQLGDRARHDAVELLEQHAHRAADRLRLLPVEPGLEDVLLELLLRNGEVVLRAPVLDEELLGDAVDVHVGRLRREHHGDQQLDVAPEVQCDLGVGVLGGESLDDRPDPLPPRSETAASRLRDVATRHACSRTPSSPRRL